MGFGTKFKRLRSFHKSTKFGSLWNLLHGFSAKSVELNGITRQNYKEFISDRQYFMGHPYNGLYSTIIDNKLYLPYLLKNFPEHTPRYFYFLNGEILRLANDGGARVPFEEFRELLHDQGRLVLKHTCSSRGEGFYLLEVDGKRGCLLNKEPRSWEEVEQFILSLDHYIVTEYVQQHHYASEVNASSLNTIRMICAWDEECGAFRLMRCFHRFGNDGALVDNVAKGNSCTVFVDTETGVLQEGTMERDGKRSYTQSVTHASGRLLTGMQVPNFCQIRDKVLEISSSLPFLRYVGWDVAVTEDGFRVIEANSLPDLGMNQRKGGYLADAVLRKIFTGKR